MIRQFFKILIITTLLGGCSFIPDYKRPEITVPITWENSSFDKTETPAADISPDWWATFDSPELNAFISRALNHNTDLAAGIQRIAQARATLKIAGADLYPNAQATGGINRRESYPADGGHFGETGANLGLSISYEADLFGANRATVAAAYANLNNTIYTQDALTLTVMGDVANGYFTYASLKERLTIADENLKIAREVLRIIKARVREGAESNLQLSQQKSAVSSAEARRASLVEQTKNAKNALAVLLGRAPSTIDIERDNLGGLVIPEIAVSQPSTLLSRRPDLRAAEANLIAANANIGAARAAFFPAVNLGLDHSAAWSGLGDPASYVLSLAASATVPVFQAGRLQGALDRTTAQRLELVEFYRGSVLNAFQETEDALAAVNAAAKREESLKIAMEQARTAYRISKQQYDAGAIDYQTLLDTQNTQLSAEDTYAQSRLARLTAAVNLYRALGGGWMTLEI